VAPQRADAVIAGVNKAGTTSLFVSLSTHPDVAPSAIKETRYFRFVWSGDGFMREIWETDADGKTVSRPGKWRELYRCILSWHHRSRSYRTQLVF
jgi:hypothetical protein